VCESAEDVSMGQGQDGDGRVKDGPAPDRRPDRSGLISPKRDIRKLNPFLW
jgi:hypothetical protein